MAMPPSMVVIDKLRLALARIVAGHHHGGLEVADLRTRHASRRAFMVGWAVDRAELGREWRGRLDHLLVERQPHALIERDGGDHAPAVPVGSDEAPVGRRS